MKKINIDTRTYNERDFVAELISMCGDTSLMTPWAVVKWLDNNVDIREHDNWGLATRIWYDEIKAQMLENKMQAVIRCMQTDNDDGLEEWLFAGNWEKMPVEDIAKEWDELCRQEEEAKKLED